MKRKCWVRQEWSTHSGKLLDFGDAIADNLWVLVFKVFGEFGNIVHLDSVPQTRLFVET